MNVLGILIGFLLKLPAILLAITVHEYAHGRAALRLGDPTAQYTGRLTLNPLRHIDPMGFICFLVIGVGWAKPVPINPRHFRNPLRDMMLSAAAGPVANLGTAVVCGVLLRVLSPEGLIFSLLVSGVVFNVALALFNFLPVHPLDGSHVLKGLLPPKAALRLSEYDRYLMYGLLLVLFMDAFFHTRILGRLLLRPILEISYFIIGR